MIGAGNGSVIEITGGTIFAVLTFICLMSNVLLIVVLMTGRKHFKGIYFYTLAYQLIICDFLICASQICVVIPVFFMDVDLDEQIEAYIDSIFFDVLINLHTVGFYGILHFTFLIAFNCYIVIATKTGAAILTPMLRNQLIAATWILTAGLSAIGIYLCQKNLDYYGLYIFKDCNNSGESGRAYRRRANRRETKLIIQAAITCAALEIGIIAFNVLPLIADLVPSNIAIWITITQNCFVIVCNSVQPMVFFTFNTEIRKQLKYLFSCH
ncbi:unnamed protein product [Anisakis simplex]|uniref:G_PROTEIN_RECEP_F1_2 domain-containing protein n=1 Tax=Anisakis simplex TaxID=6269 RepID=A0A0M3JT45_ANISI|nr:unnamed protein product [Anisakis simplex]